jgi:hypothetical protein
MLEIQVNTVGKPNITFNSEQTFGSISKGDQISIIGDGGKLVTKAIVSVEHTVWIENQAPVHKMFIKTR